MKRILILHGPNLNLLGEREPDIYGKMTLLEVNRKIRSHAKQRGVQVKIRQSNHEGQLINWLHQYRIWAEGVIFNPAAYTHTSVALRDAVSAISIPVVEVHLTEISKREAFRRKSLIKAVALAQISGLGWKSYAQAIDLLNAQTQKPTSSVQ